MVKRSKLRSKSDNVHKYPGHAKLIPYHPDQHGRNSPRIWKLYYWITDALTNAWIIVLGGIRIVDDSDYEFSGLRLLRIPLKNMYVISLSSQ